MDSIINSIRGYVFVPTGEMIRGVQIAALVTAFQVLQAQDLSKVSDWRVLGLSVAAAVGNTVIAYIYGRLPQPR